MYFKEIEHQEKLHGCDYPCHNEHERNITVYKY